VINDEAEPSTLDAWPMWAKAVEDSTEMLGSVQSE
jgi:hypothetical protein